MEISANRAAKLSAILLILTVISQLAYVGISAGGAEPPRMLIWTAEAVAFLGISVFALVAMVRASGHNAVWAAIAMGGLLNVIQVGMGLAMFGPLTEAGEAMAPAMTAVLAGAFFLYFAGKFLFGCAAVLLGAGMFGGNGAAKAIGALAILTGIAAIAANLYSMAVGMEIVRPAGAAGTAATLFLAIAIVMIPAEKDA